MSNYYLCDTCKVKHVGGAGQTFLPVFLCRADEDTNEKKIISDNQTPKEVCPYYKPKEVRP